MKAKEFLKQLKDIDKLMKTCQEEVQRIEEQLTSKAVSIKDINVQSFGSKDKIGEKAPDIADLKTEIEGYSEQLNRMKHHAFRIIKQIPDLKLQTVLMKYYIQNKTFEQTAVEMEMTYRWIQELHGEALVAYELAAEKEKEGIKNDI